MNTEISSYLAVFSHELKSPLNSIINLAKLMELKIEDSDETKLKSYISSILSSALYLKTFINNTIELGRINQGINEIYLEEFNIVEILYEIVDLTKIMVEEKPVEVKFHFPQKKINIVSDPVKVKQILLNIASNAAKFTKKGVILFLISKVKKGVLISIKDTGCGIKEENLRKIFNPYCNLGENIYESSGLGLYITKNLLSILEGDMSIKSEYNKGTEVEIFIPSKKQ